jgi:hypothetical protein
MSIEIRCVKNISFLTSYIVAIKISIIIGSKAIKATNIVTQIEAFK